MGVESKKKVSMVDPSYVITCHFTASVGRWARGNRIFEACLSLETRPEDANEPGCRWYLRCPSEVLGGSSLIQTRRRMVPGERAGFRIGQTWLEAAVNPWMRDVIGDSEFP